MHSKAGKKNERVDFLFQTRLKIIQSDDLFPFSLDSVLLSRFVYVPIRQGRLVDLCTGNGAVPFLLSQRTRGRITGVEIQPEVCDLAVRGAALNCLEDQVNFICGDAKKLPEKMGRHLCDVVTCNPPYFTKEAARDTKMNPHLAVARHEILITLTDVVRTAALLLKQGGRLAMVHRPERLAEILSVMQESGIEPKKLQMIHPRKGRQANMLLIEGTAGGRPGLTVLPPIVVYDRNGHYTEDVWPEK
ncbi:tRNA1(Val) (adenine(37)-N6)-methyltransferase [Sporolactobacillus sp. Y61]|uniref:tRNA1(Val) (Adenine(37)-N6)-methyltransferase n=1 Tax=Sporolactobacillus sp. Y61 TaxID=3160863 RepID=A0AAU8IHG7_9BACL